MPDGDLIERLRDPEHEDKDGSLLEEAADRLELYERALKAVLKAMEAE